MHSLLSLLFSCFLAGLVYGLSLLPSTSLGQTEETEEWANGSDQENSKAVVPSPEETSRGSHGRRSDAT
jgi:hypothetical protein